MNIGDRLTKVEADLADALARLEAIDGRQPVTAGGVTRGDGVTFVPGSGPMTERVPLAEVTPLPAKPAALSRCDCGAFLGWKPTADCATPERHAITTEASDA